MSSSYSSDPLRSPVFAPQFLNGKQAAMYIGYSYSQFKELAKKGRIPKSGPKRNRFDKDDLREFMKNPAIFLGSNAPKPKKKGFTPVSL